MIQDASIVDETTPDANPIDQLRYGASRLSRGSSEWPPHYVSGNGYSHGCAVLNSQPSRMPGERNGVAQDASGNYFLASCTGKHSRTTRQAALHCWCPKLAAPCALLPRHTSQLLLWPDTCPRLSPNTNNASWMTFSWPRWQVAQVEASRPTSQLQPRAVVFLQ